MTSIETAVARTAPIWASGMDAEGHPWRRYGARVIDVWLFGFTSIVLIAILFARIAPESFDWLTFPTWPMEYIIIPVGMYALGGVATALCLARWGGTPGKWLFGIKVFDADGGRLSYRQAFKREVILFWWGMGLGLGPLALLMMIRSYSEVDKGHDARWDEKAGSVVLARPLEGRVHVGVVIGTMLVIVTKVWGLFERALTQLQAG